MDYYYTTVRQAQLTNGNVTSICCPDDDGDGVCNSEDQCPGFDDNLIGTPCDDGDDCTTGETYDNSCTCSGGVSADSDGDGVCDALDICPGFDDNIDSDGDGIPDGCDNDCVASSGSFDTNPLTHVGSGSSSSSINFGANAFDVVFTISNINQKTNGKTNRRFIERVVVEYVDGGGSTQLYGSYSGANTNSVSVDIPGPVMSVTVTLSDDYDGIAPDGMSINLGQVIFCGEACADSDGDGVCDVNDICPGFDDNIDSDGDGIPDGCDDCNNSIASFSPSLLTHTGTGSSIATTTVMNGSNIQFMVTNINSNIKGNPSNRFIDKVVVSYNNGSGTVIHGTYLGTNVSQANISIVGPASDIEVSLSDDYDGNGPDMTVNLGQISYCPETTQGDELEEEVDRIGFDELLVFPNPANNLVHIKVSEELIQEIEIFNSTGKRVLMKSNWPSSEVLDLGSINNGLYIIRAKVNNTWKTTKLVKF